MRLFGRIYLSLCPCPVCLASWLFTCKYTHLRVYQIRVRLRVTYIHVRYFCQMHLFFFGQSPAQGDLNEQTKSFLMAPGSHGQLMCQSLANGARANGPSSGKCVAIREQFAVKVCFGGRYECVCERAYGWRRIDISRQFFFYTDSTHILVCRYVGSAPRKSEAKLCCLLLSLSRSLRVKWQ